MGRRSRKRGVTTRAERDAARRERPRRARTSASERPRAPWGSFPLSELVILAGIGVIVWGFLSGADKGDERVAAGLVLASLGGGELALREHLAGFRSHSALLAGVAAFAVVTAVALGLGPVKVWVLLVTGAAVFAAAFYAMRELFKRRSGGLGFR
ncbi:MAG: hypothetical protein QOH58_2811 [Thermoleophilaceae bacterium]|jgi:hypothetical protein|nr:hypothetical protein [Thermoleophilaceae bacterium]